MRSFAAIATLAGLSHLPLSASAEQVHAAWAQITGSDGQTILSKGQMPLNLSLRFITSQPSCPAYKIGATIPGQTGIVSQPVWDMRQNRPDSGFDAVTVCQTRMDEDWTSASLLDSAGNSVTTPNGVDVVLAGAGRRSGQAPRFVAFGDTGCR